MKLTFNKEAGNRWYVVLPAWQGAKADLEMVAGADIMLEYMAEGNDFVNLVVHTEKFEGADILNFVIMATELGNGVFYKLETYRGIEINLDIWLCDVTKFVFGNFPKQIYVSVVN